MENWIELTLGSGKLLTLPYNLIDSVIETDTGADVYIKGSVIFYSVTEPYSEVNLRMSNAVVRWRDQTTTVVADAQRLLFAISQGGYPSTLPQLITVAVALILWRKSSQKQEDMS
jgi:hypothetical protein